MRFGGPRWKWSWLASEAMISAASHPMAGAPLRLASLRYCVAFVGGCATTLYFYIMIRGSPVFPVALLVPGALTLLLLGQLREIRLNGLTALILAYVAWPILSLLPATLLVIQEFGIGAVNNQIISFIYFYVSMVPFFLGFALARLGGREVRPIVHGFSVSLLLNVLFVLAVFAYYYPDLYQSRGIVKQRLPLIICYLSTVALVMAGSSRKAPRLLPALGLLTVGLALSRGSFLQLIASIAALFACFPQAFVRLGWRLRRYWVVGAVGILAVAAFSPRAWQVLETVLQRFSALVTPAELGREDYSASVRIEIWHALLREMCERPLSFVFGFGQLGPSYIGPTFTSSEREIIQSYSAHSQYLDTLVRGGIPAVILECFLWICVISVALRGRFASRDQELFARGNGVALLGVLAFGLFHETLRWSLFSALFWMFAGWLAGAVQPQSRFRTR